MEKKKRKNMVMTDEDILQSWNEAKDRCAQVQILADLNVCSVDKIIEILKAQGVDGRQLPRKKKAAPFVLSEGETASTVAEAVAEDVSEAVDETVDEAVTEAGEVRIVPVDPAEGIVAEALEYYRRDLVRTIDKMKEEYEEIMAEYAHKINKIDMCLAGVKIV